MYRGRVASCALLFFNSIFTALKYDRNDVRFHLKAFTILRGKLIGNLNRSHFFFAAGSAGSPYAI